MPKPSFDEIIKDSPLYKLEVLLTDAFDQMIDFFTHYMFLVIALASIARILIRLISGRGVGIITILIAVISSAMAIAAGVFFWR